MQKVYDLLFVLKLFLQQVLLLIGGELFLDEAVMLLAIVYVDEDAEQPDGILGNL